MSAMSDYLENKLVDLTLRGQAFTAPATLYFGLHTAATTDAGGGTEVTGGSYARVAVTASLANFNGTQGSAGAVSSGTGGVTSNATTITFPAPTANWGVVSHFGIWDAASAGNLLFHGALSTSKTINNGDAAPSFAASALTLTFA
jgi:hypothetical protein